MIAKIVVPSNGDGFTKTQGTQVWVGDQQLTGIFKVELTAEVNDLWRATIHCRVQPSPEVLAEALVEEHAFVSVKELERLREIEWMYKELQD